MISPISKASVLEVLKQELHLLNQHILQATYSFKGFITYLSCTNNQIYIQEAFV